MRNLVTAMPTLHALTTRTRALEPAVVGACTCGWRTGRSTVAQAEAEWAHHVRCVEGDPR